MLKLFLFSYQHFSTYLKASVVFTMLIDFNNTLQFYHPSWHELVYCPIRHASDSKDINRFTH